jgi:hypothetical protein
MENTRVLKEHSCFQKDHPLTPVRCRCRKYITEAEAAEKIRNGTAQYVIKSYKNLTVEEVCPVCFGDEKLVRSCSFCGKTGKVNVTKPLPVYGEDIIVTVAEKRGKLANATSKKTPRSPTIEKNHILRGVGLMYAGAEAANERWDEYELLTLKERIRLLSPRVPVELFDQAWNLWMVDTTLPFPFILNSEPEDDLKTGTGRRFDYGRSI